jgi:LPPG:FO 2-phospho-L-lactate transferase
MYLFAGILDTDTWWGIRNDTFTTHDAAQQLGTDEFIAIGDRDRAVHIARAGMLRNGMRLTATTKILCDRFGVLENVLPMTDTEVTTYIKTGTGVIHFQEYWVRAKGAPEIQKVVRSYTKPPVATEEVMAAVESSDTVVIGPSNPVTSILPILDCEGIRRALKNTRVIAISPFIGNAPVSGPAAALMRASGFEPSSEGTFSCYGGLVDIFVQDIRDPVDVSGSVRFDTLMIDEGKSIALAKQIVRLARGS